MVHGVPIGTPSAKQSIVKKVVDKYDQLKWKYIKSMNDNFPNRAKWFQHIAHSCFNSEAHH